MKMMTVNKTIPIKLIWMDNINGIAKAIDFNVKYSLRTEQGDQNYEEAFISQNISFTTVNEFLYSQIHQSVVYDDAAKRDVENIFSTYNNNFCYLPKMSEAIFLTALHCKLNSICHDSSIIEIVELDDTCDNVCYSHFNEDLEYETLPTVVEWLGERSFWDKPWWLRKDFSTFDNIAISDEEWEEWNTKTNKQEVLNKMAEPIKEIEEEVKSALSQNTEEGSKGHLIEVDFKTGKKSAPKLVPKPKN